MKLTSIRLQRFKRISDAPFDLGRVNVLVGANNAGKSSVIQGLHFGIGLLQTIGLANDKTFPSATSLSPNQLLYSPSENAYALGAGGKLEEPKARAIVLEFGLDDGRKLKLGVSKGRNRNITVSLDNPKVAGELASLERPFSIFSPGLAGIAKAESFVSDGVLLRTLARGDANLILRNILLRLWKTPEWPKFLSDLHEVFSGLDLDVTFRQETDEFITVRVKTGSDWVPLELAGTGILQAIQILSYVHKFSPSLVVLDEPDSHLHPNNQRLLCALLREVAEQRDTQILLTTHSRHVVDALAPYATFLWVRNGGVDAATADDEIGILLDIGALDIKERVGTPGTKAIVLTEDENSRGLEVLLQASGFDMSSTTVLPYHGATTLKHLRPLVRMIQTSNPKARIVLHRDRDFFSDDRVGKWETQVRRLSVEPFVTLGVDVESHLLEPGHLAALNKELDEGGFKKLIRKVSVEIRDELVKKVVNGEIDVHRAEGTYGKLDVGQLAARAPKVIDAEPQRYVHGKTLLRAVRERFKRDTGKNLKDLSATKHVEVAALSTIAQKIFGGAATKRAKSAS